MSTKPWNILLLTVDCWRADYLGEQGDDDSPTPFIDILASRSAVFQQAIACGGWTRPSLTAMFSSTQASLYGGPLGKLSSQRPMLPVLLQEHGYDTAGFTTNPQVGKLFGFEHGFNTFVDCEPDGTFAGPGWARINGAQKLLQKPLTHSVLNRLGVNSLPPEITVPANQLSELAADWMVQPRKQPFFLWAHFMDAHWPYHNLRKPYTPSEAAQSWRDINLMYRISGEHGRMYPGNEQVARLRQLYGEAISFVDQWIGYLIYHLQSSEVLDRTVVILTSDHGEEFYEHGRWGHYQMYDESLRVPLLVHIPERAKNTHVTQQVSLLDIAPTILSLANINIPAEMKGVDLKCYLDDQSNPPQDAYAESIWSDNYRLAIRNERFKYIYDQKRAPDCELYDLQEDPGEKRNIYDPHTSIAQKFDEKRKRIESLAEKTSQGARKSAKLDPAMLERLRALGYLE